MTAYTVIRSISVVMAVLCAVLFVYVDRGAWRLLKQGLLSGGEFLGKFARVGYVLANANATAIAVRASKPAGVYVIWLFLTTLILAIAIVWQTSDIVHEKRDRRAQRKASE